MNQGKLVFAQLMQHVPLTTFRRCVARYQGERKVHSFSCLDQFLSMALPPTSGGRETILCGWRLGADMSEGASVLGILHMGIGLLLIGLSIPLLRGRVRMNGWYGVRVPQAFRSEANWYSLNRYGAIQLMCYGAVLIVLGVVLVLIPPRPGSVWFVIGLAAPGLLIVPMLVMVFRFAKRLP